MTDYFVQPYDVLFFRGNKSFDFGEWYTEGVFPPYPTTFQGFVRNKVLRDAGIDDDPKASGKDWEQIGNAVGNDNNIPIPFDIYGPFLMTDGGSPEIYFKTPLDLHRRKKGDEHFDSFCPERAGHDIESDRTSVMQCPVFSEGKLDKLKPPEYIGLGSLLDYRLKTSGLMLPDVVSPVVREERVVIGLDDNAVLKKRRAVKETRFCVTAYNRLQDNAGLHFSLESTDGKTLPNITDGPLRLGAEAHPVCIQQLGDKLLETTLKVNRKELINGIFKTKTFRLVLLQPGVFSAGWLPFEMQEENDELIADVNGLKLKLLFAFSGEPFMLSGYSFAVNKIASDQNGITLRPQVRAVPAGAVYAFSIVNEVDEETIKRFVHNYDNKKIDYQPYSRMGFNHVILACGK